MARTSSVWKILLLGMLAHVSLAQAQQTPSSAPPKLERIEEGSDTPITVTPQQRGGKKIVEKRDGGRTTEVAGHDRQEQLHDEGAIRRTPSRQPGDAPAARLRPPQWKVLEFDLFKKKQKKEPTRQPPPRPPTRRRHRRRRPAK